MKIIFPDRIDLDEPSKQKFQAMGVQMYDDTPSDENVIIERIKDAEIITANFIDITAKAIRGAGLDVFLDEPFTGGAPDSIVEIAKLPNVVATPHLAYNTEETMQRLGKELLADVESCLQGKPLNVVNENL